MLPIIYISVTAVGLTVSATPAELTAYVLEVYDGDTFTVELTDGTVEKVRLIGIDTPELHDNVHGASDPVYGPAARDHLADLIIDSYVILVLGIKERDQYGRLLAYAYLDDPDGRIFINAELIRAGYAVVYTVPPNVEQADILLAAEREAREAHRGLWAL